MCAKLNRDMVICKSETVMIEDDFLDFIYYLSRLGNKKIKITEKTTAVRWVWDELLIIFPSYIIWLLLWCVHLSEAYLHTVDSCPK